MDFYDTDDLLGNSQMPVRQQQRSLLSTLFDYSFYAFFLFACCIVYICCRRYYLNWLDTNCKLAIRRKYGIPDENHEPFNVAYAKAEQKRKELARIAAHQEEVAAARAAQAQKKPVPSAPLPEPRFDRPSRYNLPVRQFSAARTLNLGKTGPSWNPNLYSDIAAIGTSKSLQRDTSRHASKSKQDTSDHNRSGSPKQRKRSLEKDDLASSKKSRKESPRNRAISIDITDLENRNASLSKPARGSKRHAGPEEEIANVGSIGKKAGKRARKQSKKIQETFTGDAENDQPMDLDLLSRGKKRDRNEAGSSFGGEEDSHVNSHGRKKRSQKRKTNTSSDADAAVKARGTKRSYEIESTLGSEEEDRNIRNPKTSRKRGKRIEIEIESDSDVSMEDLDASCGGRKIGEEWKINGELFKVGPDGRRLHQTLLRKRRSRFIMPEDSEHPDLVAQYEFLNETWLNDEEYDAALKRGDIYFPAKELEAENAKTAAKAGKQLLYTAPYRSTTSLRMMNNSLIISSSKYNNPFERPSKGVPGRIGISADFTPPPRVAPAMRGTRSYSKWEKQDLEAEALARLHKKLESEKKEPTSILKKVTFDVPPSTGSSSPAPTPPIANNTSAPASFPAPSPAPSMMPNVPAPQAPATNGFAFPTSNGNVSNTPAPSFNAMPAIESTQPKMPSFSVTPPQPATEPATGPAKPVFGNSPFNTQPATTQTTNSPFHTQPATTQPTAAPSENKAQSPFGGQTNGMSFSSTPAPNPFGTAMKSQTPSTPAPTPSVNMFSAKPTASFTAPNQMSNGMNGAPSVFSSGNKPAAQTTMSPFGAPSSNGFTPNMGASASGPASNNSTSPFTLGGSSNQQSNSFNMGASASGPASNNSSSPFTLGGSSNQQSNSFNKPAEQQTSTAASAAPKFSFGNIAKPAAPSSSPSPAPVAAAASKSTPSPSPFGGFGSTSTPSSSAMSGISTSAASATTSQPKFSFGATPAASSSAAPAATNGATNGFSNNTNGTTTNSTGNSATPAASGFSTFKFGTAQPIASPFGNTSSAPSPFGAAPNSSAPSSFGTTSSGFSKTVAPTPAPFGVSAKQNGEAPKTSFGSSAQAVSDKPQFSFNFSAPSASTPTFSATQAQNGTSAHNPFGFSIPVNGSTNGFSSSAFGQK